MFKDYTDSVELPIDANCRLQTDYVCFPKSKAVVSKSLKNIELTRVSTLESYDEAWFVLKKLEVHQIHNVLLMNINAGVSLGCFI